MNDNLMTMRESAEWAMCSRKTLYRYMSKGLLPYQLGRNQRRYIHRKDLEELFIIRRNKADSQYHQYIVTLIGEMRVGLHQQRNLIERMLALYRPKSLAELTLKHRAT